MQNIKRFDDKPYMTIGIIVVNIIVFVLMSISGSTLDAQYMAAHGAMYPEYIKDCLLYTSPSPRDYAASRMPSSA